VSSKQSQSVEVSKALGAPKNTVSALGLDDFRVTENLISINGLPVLDWEAAQQWVDGVSGEEAQARAWSDCERAWLEHLRAALGPQYQLRQQGTAMLLSTLQSNVSEATLTFVNKTLQRVERILDGIAQVQASGYDILIVFDDDDTYYKYVARYYTEAGEFARSGGMYINSGCGHFVTVNSDLRSIEPVIAHELTHSCLSHLPIPAWLNEGIAVSVERRLCPQNFANSTPLQMHARHREFWTPTHVQQFWSGESFMHTDEGNELSYDLARIIVSQFGTDWDRFRSFVFAASVEDAGESAAVEHLGSSLGDVVCALLEQEPSPNWAPNPAAWDGTPQRGGFRW
jgi:hypothetical protein